MEEKIDYSKMDYEEAVELVKKRNEKYLDIFLEELKSKGITPKTIENHMLTLSSISMIICAIMMRRILKKA